MAAGACESVKKFVAADESRAERAHVRRQHLNVEPVESARAQVFDQKQQREFRGVGAQVEHALARERAARVNAVEAADQLAALPSLRAVRVAEAVKLRVAAHHRGRYPRPRFVRARDRRARRDDAPERAVNREAEARAPPLARETARDVQFVEDEYGALRRAEPEERVALDGPREDSVRVGLDEQFRVGAAPDGDDAFGRRVARVWETYYHRSRNDSEGKPDGEGKRQEVKGKRQKWKTEPRTPPSSLLPFALCLLPFAF